MKASAADSPPQRIESAARAGGGKAVTISDVAAEARVARSTVSRALNHPGRLRPETQQHVRAVADRLGYRPNPVARALGGRRTDTIALLVRDLTNPYFLSVIRGVERQSSAAGYSLILSDCRQDPDREESRIQALTGAVDGFILVSPDLAQQRLLQLADGRRIVLINRQIPGLSSVVVDPTLGPAHAVEHLVSLGHRRIAYLGATPKTSWSNVRRWKSVSDTATDMGISTRQLGPFGSEQSGGAAAADAAIAYGATAVIAFNDLLAIGVMQRLTERGIAIPGEMSVVGFDDIVGADFCVPALTTVFAPVEELGRTAVHQLQEISGQQPAKPSEKTLATHLVVRGSTGPVRSEPSTAAH